MNSERLRLDDPGSPGQGKPRLLYNCSTCETILKRDGVVADERERSARHAVLTCP